MTSIAQQIDKSRRETLEAIEAFIERHAELNPSRFGRLAMGDPTFVYEIRKGRKMEPETIDALRVFMSAYRPAKRGKGKPPRGGANVAAA